MPSNSPVEVGSGALVIAAALAAEAARAPSPFSGLANHQCPLQLHHWVAESSSAISSGTSLS
jgi:hypothetical protein